MIGEKIVTIREKAADHISKILDKDDPTEKEMELLGLYTTIMKYCFDISQRVDADAAYYRRRYSQRNLFCEQEHRDPPSEPIPKEN